MSQLLLAHPPPFYMSLSVSSNQHCHLYKLPYQYLHLKMLCICLIVGLMGYENMAALGDQQLLLIHLFHTHVESQLDATAA